MKALGRHLVVEILEPLRSKIRDHQEWGGWIRPNASLVGPRPGGSREFARGTPAEERARGEVGWVGFHTHPVKGGSPEPSAADIVATMTRGTAEYVVTSAGIWEIRPLEVWDLQRVLGWKERLWREAEEEAGQWGDDLYWYWASRVKREAPVSMELIRRW